MDIVEKVSSKKRLIDANKLIDFIDVGHLRHPGELCYSEVDVANILLHAPTVDAVEVVRCRECKHHRDKNEQERKYLAEDILICTSPDATEDCWNAVWPDHFCSYGERKEGDD